MGMVAVEFAFGPPFKDWVLVFVEFDIKVEFELGLALGAGVGVGLGFIGEGSGVAGVSNSPIIPAKFFNSFLKF